MLLIIKRCLLIVLITLSITSCATTRNTSGSSENHFPIRIVSGSVRASISGFRDSSKNVFSMKDYKAGEHLTDQEKEYLDEVNKAAITPTQSSLADYSAGEFIYYKIRRNEVITVNIMLTSEDAIIESGKKLYALSKDKPDLQLIIFD